MILSLQQKEQEVQRLTQRLVASPGSGSDGVAQEDLSGITYQEALVMLSVKNRKLSELETRCHELEKMLDERNEEIQELEQENDRFMERGDQEPSLREIHD